MFVASDNCLDVGWFGRTTDTLTSCLLTIKIYTSNVFEDHDSIILR